MVVGFIFLMFLIGIIVTSFIFYKRSKEMENQQQLPPGYGGGGFTPANRQLTNDSPSSTLTNLRINDIVSYFGTDYLVEGRLNFWEDGYTWTTYMLVDGDEVKWLAVEEDDMLEVSLWEEVEDLHLREPLPETIDYRGLHFRMTERGQARVNQQGRTKNKSGLNVDYYEYEAQGDDAMLSVEKWASSIEVSIGHEIRPSVLDILPGDKVEY